MLLTQENEKYSEEVFPGTHVSTCVDVRQKRRGFLQHFSQQSVNPEANFNVSIS